MRTRGAICITLTVALILGMALPGFSMYVGNYSEESFDEPENQTMAVKSTEISESIRYLIIESATCFLKGKTKIDLLASKLEAAEKDGVSFPELQTIVNDSLYNMRTALYYYQALKYKADNTPYNQVVINQLISFDYDSFSIKFSLNSDIYNQVKGYLQVGDVRGAYARFYTYTANIVGMLEMVREDIYCGNIPETGTIWKLNQECAHMHLFGQYIAQTYYNLLCLH